MEGERSDKMAPTDTVALLLAPSQLCSMLFWCYFLHYVLRTFLVFLPTAGNNFRTLDWRSVTINVTINVTSLNWILCLYLLRELHSSQGLQQNEEEEEEVGS